MVDSLFVFFNENFIFATKSSLNLMKKQHPSGSANGLVCRSLIGLNAQSTAHMPRCLGLELVDIWGAVHA